MMTEKYYRRKRGLHPENALKWYSSWISIDIKGSNVNICKALAAVMDADLSDIIGFARVPGAGWHEATEPATHQEQLFRDCKINQWNSGEGTVIFDFDVQGRFIPLLASFVKRTLARRVPAEALADVELLIHHYSFDYPDWNEVAPPPEPAQPEPPPPLTRADCESPDGNS